MIIDSRWFDPRFLLGVPLLASIAYGIRIVYEWVNDGLSSLWAYFFGRPEEFVDWVPSYKQVGLEYIDDYGLFFNISNWFDRLGQMLEGDSQLFEGAVQWFGGIDKAGDFMMGWQALEWIFYAVPAFYYHIFISPILAIGSIWNWMYTDGLTGFGIIDFIPAVIAVLFWFAFIVGLFKGIAIDPIPRQKRAKYYAIFFAPAIVWMAAVTIAMFGVSFFCVWFYKVVLFPLIFVKETWIFFYSGVTDIWIVDTFLALLSSAWALLAAVWFYLLVFGEMSWKVRRAFVVTFFIPGMVFLGIFSWDYFGMQVYLNDVSMPALRERLYLVFSEIDILPN